MSYFTPPSAGSQENSAPIFDPNNPDHLRANIAAAQKRLAEIDPDSVRPRPLPELRKRKTYEFPKWSFGDGLDEVVDAITKRSKCHQDIACQEILGLMALALQPHIDVCLPYNNKVVPTSLYIVTVADPSDRKSTASEYAQQAALLWEDQLAKNTKEARAVFVIESAQFEVRRKAIMADKGLTAKQKAFMIDREEPKPPADAILRTDRPTVEGIRDAVIGGVQNIGLYNDDGASFLGSYSMQKEQAQATAGLLSQWWGARPSNKTMSGRNVGRMDNYRFSCNLSIQPGIATQMFGNETFKAQGILTRFLMSWPDSEGLHGTRLSEDPDPADQAAIDQFTQYAYSWFARPLPVDPETKKLKPVVLEGTPEAKAMSAEWHDSLERKKATGGEFAHIRGFVGKALENAWRIAALLQTFHTAQFSLIEAEWLERALEIVEYYIHQHGNLGDGMNRQELVDAYAVLQFLEEENDSRGDEFWSERTLRNWLRPNHLRFNVSRLRAAITELEAHNILQKAPTGSIVRGDRPARECWSVHFPK